MTQLLQLQRTEVLKLNSGSYKIQTLDLCDHGRCSTLPIELTSQLGVRGGGYSGFQVTGMIERAKNQNQKNPKGFKQTPQKLLDQNLSPEKFHAEFPSHKNFQNTETVAKQLCFYFNYGSITRQLSRIFRLF